MFPRLCSGYICKEKKGRCGAGGWAFPRHGLARDLLLFFSIPYIPEDRPWTWVRMISVFGCGLPHPSLVGTYREIRLFFSPLFSFPGVFGYGGVRWGGRSNPIFSFLFSNSRGGTCLLKSPVPAPYSPPILQAYMVSIVKWHRGGG